jgi:hypothetical protein
VLRWYMQRPIPRERESFDDLVARLGRAAVAARDLAFELETANALRRHALREALALKRPVQPAALLRTNEAQARRDLVDALREIRRWTANGGWSYENMREYLAIRGAPLDDIDIAASDDHEVVRAFAMRLRASGLIASALASRAARGEAGTRGKGLASLLSAATEEGVGRAELARAMGELRIDGGDAASWRERLRSATKQARKTKQARRQLVGAI